MTRGARKYLHQNRGICIAFNGEMKDNAQVDWATERKTHLENNRRNKE